MRSETRAILAAGAMLAAAVLGGCETVKDRIERNRSYYDSMPLSHQILVLRGQIAVGFEPTEVYLAWGEPNHKTITESSRGRLETWIYTTTRTETRYRRVPQYKKGTDHVIYVDEPYYIYHYYLDKDAVFLNGRVDAWTQYPDLMPYRPYMP
jgi:hypothetical protein